MERESTIAELVPKYFSGIQRVEQRMREWEDTIKPNIKSWINPYSIHLELPVEYSNTDLSYGAFRVRLPGVEINDLKDVGPIGINGGELHFIPDGFGTVKVEMIMPHYPNSMPEVGFMENLEYSSINQGKVAAIFRSFLEDCVMHFIHCLKI